MIEDLVNQSILNINSYVVSDFVSKYKMDANENFTNFFNDMKDEIDKEMEKIEFNRYPDTDSINLRQSISKYTGADVSRIICGNGSDEIINHIIKLFVDKGENIVIHSPTFAMYKIYNDLNSGNTIEIKSKSNYEIDHLEMIKAANENNAKVIFLCNPNNPTGTIIKKEIIKEIIESTKSIVVLDEAYYEFFGESMIDEISEYNRLIILRTFSKAFGIAHLRVGYGISNKEIIDLLNKVKSPYNLNGFSQMVASVYVKNFEIIKKSIDEIIREREYLYQNIKEIGDIDVFESYSNFIFIKLNKCKELFEKCKNEGMHIKLLEKLSAVRVTISKREANDAFIKALKETVI